MSLVNAHARLDKWLWGVRLFKTRALATAACRAESVLVSEVAAKPAREVRPGEIVSVRQGIITRRLRVISSPSSRVGPKLVEDYCEDLTAPEEYEKLKVPRVDQILARERGAGRPTKKDRRLLDQLREQE